MRKQDSRMFIAALLGGGGIAISGPHQADQGHVEMVLAFTRMGIVLEPLLVLFGLLFLWFGITREHRRAPRNTVKETKSQV